MTTRSRLFRLALAVVLLTGIAAVWFVPPASAKSFVFSRVDIDAVVAADGNLRITEARTYRFDGSFSWASYRLPTTGASRISGIRVRDERAAYTPVGSVPSGNPVPPGRFVVTRDDEGVLIRWGFAAADESRTFTITYLLDDVVTVYGDVAELYWKFIGTGWDAGSEDVRVAVRLPGRVPAEEIKVWAHGPLHGAVERVPEGAVLTVRNLPASTMVEGRLVFPREVVPQARRRHAETALPRILKEEGEWTAQANRRRTIARATQFGMVGLPIVVLLAWVWLYLRYGREPRPTAPEGYYRELPGTYTPAELGVLWRFGAVQPADFVATLLDLTRRGYVTVEAGVRDGFLGFGKDETYTLTRTSQAAGLRDFEAEVLRMLFGPAGAEGNSAGDAVTLSRKRGLPDDVKKRVGRQFSSWTRSVKDAAKAERFFDDASGRASAASYAAGFLIIFVGWFGAISLQSFVGIAATVISAIVLILGAGALRRRSQKGADDLRRWQGFRRFLLDFSEMPRAELPALVLWEHYLVYAVPLGVADRVIEQLGKIYPANELARSPTLGAWASSGGSGRGGSALASLSGFTAALAMATSSASSGSGGGGGFSGGGGGGGGGSGGSAG